MIVQYSSGDWKHPLRFQFDWTRKNHPINSRKHLEGAVRNPIAKVSQTRIWMHLFCISAIMACFISPCVATADDITVLAKPFIGKWEGKWSIGLGAADYGTRECKLNVFVDNGQVLVDYYVGRFAYQNLASYSRGPEVSKAKAEITSLNGQLYLVFTDINANGFRFTLKGEKLIGEPLAHGATYKTCTLAKQK